MRNFLILVFIIICVFPIYTINSYLCEEIGLITIGEEKNELGYRKIGPGGIGSDVSHPQAFIINPKTNMLYISDPVKKRIVVFDIQLNFVKEIKVNGYNLSSVMIIKFNESNDIIFTDTYGITKISNEYDLEFYIDNNELPSNITYSSNYYPITDSIYFYNKNGKIQIIDKNGKISSETESKQVLTNLYNNQLNDIKSINILNNQDYTYFKENNILVNGNRVLTTNKYKAKKQYYDHIKEQVKKEARNELLSRGILKENGFTPDFDVYDTMETFIGYDSDDNAYWNGWVDGKRVVIVLNILGEAVDCFEIEQKFKQQIVAPSGDVYMWEIKSEGVTFYKITRRW